MKTNLASVISPARGFTLTELLVVIAVIGVLASFLFPAIGKARVKAQIKHAQVDEKQLAGAISSYKADYNRFPISQPAATAAAATSWGDFTFGTAGTTFASLLNGTPAYEANNSEITAILTPETTNRMGIATVNSTLRYNPRKIAFLNTRPTDATNLAPASASAGMGMSGVFCDPWSRPYIVTVDANYSDTCRDALYKRAAVSQSAGQTGLVGTFNPVSAGSDHYEVRDDVLVWSAGPDRSFSGGQPANASVNTDNILSWFK